MPPLPCWDGSQPPADLRRRLAIVRKPLKLSVFTPSHRPRYLNECYASLAAQTYSDWEWIVLLNGGGGTWRPPVDDERIKVLRDRSVKGVGAAKRAACAVAEGEVLVELDHDDLMASTCLERVADAFESDPGAALVFSDFAQIGEDGSRNDDRFDLSYGWVYDEVEVDGNTYLRCNALQASPHNVAYIWYAPNHVRAFRRGIYEQVGGYDASLEVLDDQELMTRLYGAGHFHHIPECLYFQRVHPGNTQIRPRTNAFIQAQTVAYYQQSINDLMHAWCKRAGLAEIGVRIPGTIGTDRPQPDTVIDLDVQNPAIALPQNSVGAIHAIEVLQHLPDRAAFFNECYRVLAHGGAVLTETPSTDGRGAFQDPSHVSFWNENSFWYLTQAALRPSIPDLTGRFQISHIRTYHPTAWHEQVNISYVQANLLAVKDGPRQGGPLLC